MNETYLWNGELWFQLVLGLSFVGLQVELSRSLLVQSSVQR
jgi:hypothetical protein